VTNVPAPPSPAARTRRSRCSIRADQHGAHARSRLAPLCNYAKTRTTRRSPCASARPPTTRTATERRGASHDRHRQRPERPRSRFAPRLPHSRMGTSGEGSPKLADIDGDGIRDIVFGATDGTVHVLTLSTGVPVEATGFPVHTSTQLDGLNPNHRSERAELPEGARLHEGADDPRPDIHETLDSTAAVGDINGDGQPDIVASTWDGTIYVVRLTRARCSLAGLCGCRSCRRARSIQPRRSRRATAWISRTRWRAERTERRCSSTSTRRHARRHSIGVRRQHLRLQGPTARRCRAGPCAQHVTGGEVDRIMATPHVADSTATASSMSSPARTRSSAAVARPDPSSSSTGAA
jgi:hypothetical protein